MVTRTFRRSFTVMVPLLFLAACAPGNKLHVPGELSRPPRPGAPPAGAPVAAVADFSYASEAPGVIGRDYDQVRQIVWKGEPGKAMADLVAGALTDGGSPAVRVPADAPAPADVPVRISGSVRRFEVNARRGGVLNVLTEATVTLVITASGPGVPPSWESTVTSGTTLTDMFPTPDDLREALLSAANSAAEETARRLLEGRVIPAPSAADKGGGGTSR